MAQRSIPRITMALLLFLLLLCGVVPLVLGDPIVLECLVDGVNNPDQPMISIGWKAAVTGLNSRSSWGVGWSTLSVSSSPSASIASSIYSAAYAASAVMQFGIYDDDSTLAVMNAPEFTSNNLVLMGPYTQSTGVRHWNDNVYFMTADPMAELIGLLSWTFSANAAGKVKTTRVGWMFLSGGVFESKLTDLMSTQLSLLGLQPPLSYSAAVGSPFSTATFSTYMAQQPTCMFLFGARGAHTASFFQALIQDAYVLTNGASFYVMMPFALMYTTAAAYQSLYLQNAASVIPMGNIRYSTPLPSPMDTTYAASTQFQADVNTRIGLTGSSLQTTSGYLMYYGWIFMQQIYYVTFIYSPGGMTTYPRQYLKENMFRQNRYYLSDIVLGNYGGTCPNEKTATRLGAACSCNQGGHHVSVGYISSVAAVNGDNSGVGIATASDYFFPNNPCYTNQNVTVTFLPVNGIVVSMTSNAEASSLASQAAAAFSGLSAGEAELKASPLTLSMTSLTASTPSDAAAAVATQSAVTPLSIITGPIASPFLPESMPDYLFVDPIVIPPALEPSTATNAIYLSATLRQQIFVVASYLGSLVDQKSTLLSAGVNLRCSTGNDALVLEMVRYSLGFFNVPIGSAMGVGKTVNFIEMLPTSGYTFVIGLNASLIASLKPFLTTNTDAYIIVSFDDLTVFYDDFTTAFGTTSSPFMNQVLFATNVPSWTEPGTGTIFQKFVSDTPAAAHTPAGMRAFVAALSTLSSNNRTRSTTAQSLQATLYERTFFQLGGQLYGPFLQSNALYAPAYPLSRLANFGARNISVWSYTRIVNPATALIAAPTTMTVLYQNPAALAGTTSPSTTTTTTTPGTTTTTSTTTTTTTLPPCDLTAAPTTLHPTHTTTTTTTTTLIPKKHIKSDAWKYVVLVILGILLVATVLLIAHLGGRVLPCFGGEPMHCAPVDCDAATTVVFVEVEKWSDVQRAVPDASAECVAEYRNVVRRLVEKHDCYECGSWMDAFMVVSRHADSALKFAAALQKELDGMHGPAVDAVDAAYAGLGLPSSASVRGLRVRVGVHTDVVDIAYDVDTDHYEYRGSGCVAALRTERLAHGGQVLVTGATCEALTEKQLARVSAVSVGTHSFDEYDEPVPLFELVVLPHREFGVTVALPVSVRDGDRVLSLCSEELDRSADSSSEIAVCREVLNMVYLPLPVKERITVLRGKCEEHGLMVPGRGRSVSDERYADMVLNVFAEDLSRSCNGSFQHRKKVG